MNQELTELQSQQVVYRRAFIWFAVFAAPLTYACIVPVSNEVRRADWRLVIPGVLLFGMPFLIPFAYLVGPFGSLKFIAWFWRKCISPRTEAHLLLKAYVFSVFLVLLLVDLGIFCWMSPEFLEFMNTYCSWIGRAFDKCFGA